MNGYQLALAHVGQQDPDHAQRKIEIGRQVGDRHRAAAQPQYLRMFGLEKHAVDRFDVDCGSDHGEQVKALAARAGAAAGKCVGPDDRTRSPVEPLVRH